MDCQRLQNLIKNWYLQVQDEALAPARMVAFMKKHIEECATCLADPVVRQEVDKITNYVLPPSKIPKAVKEAAEVEEEEELAPADEGDESDEETEEEEEESSDDEEDEDDDYDDEDEEDEDDFDSMSDDDDDI